MAWTQADIDTLKAAIATGVQEVEYDGPPKRRVKYQSFEQMRGALALMQAEVSGASRPAYRLASTSKGL